MIVYGVFDLDDGALMDVFLHEVDAEFFAFAEENHYYVKELEVKEKLLN
jgi:hypothetical protein